MTEWPECVPPPFRVPEQKRRKQTGREYKFLGPDTWRDACLAAQAAGWRWEFRGSTGEWCDDHSEPLEFDRAPDRYRIIHGPCPEDHEIRRGDGVWIISKGDRLWTGRVIELENEWKVDGCVSLASVPDVYYAIPRKAEPPEADQNNQQWPACVPPGYGILGPEGSRLNWRELCLAAQRDGWRWEFRPLIEGYRLEGFRLNQDWILQFENPPECYRIAHGPPPKGCEVMYLPFMAPILVGAKRWLTDEWCECEGNNPGGYYALPPPTAAPETDPDSLFLSGSPEDTMFHDQDYRNAISAIWLAGHNEGCRVAQLKQMVDELEADPPADEPDLPHDPEWSAKRAARFKKPGDGQRTEFGYSWTCERCNARQTTPLLCFSCKRYSDFKTPGKKLPGHVTVPRDLFEWMVEYAIELRGLSGWKDHPMYKDELEQLDGFIEQALAAMGKGEE